MAYICSLLEHVMHWQTYTHSSACAIKTYFHVRGGERERERERDRERETMGYKAELITPWGMLGDSDLDALREAIDALKKEFCLLAIRTAILRSFGI